MTGMAVVVGASSDIGRAIALELARGGSPVVLWGRDGDRLVATADACSAAGVETEVRSIDVRDAAGVRAAAAETTRRHDVRIVVWAAGAFQWGGYETANEAELDDVLSSTFTAAVVATRAFAPALVAAGTGCLVLIGSAAGIRPFADNAAYVAAKHGLRGLAGALHLDLCDAGVTVSLISAGLVSAGAGLRAPAASTHLDALVRPEDIARAVRFVVDSPPNVCPTEIVLQPATRHV